MARKKQNAASSAVCAVAVPQTAAKTHPFSALAGYYPGRQSELALYRALREAVPIIDAAITKTVRLLGEFRVVCENAQAQGPMNRFLETVNVGGARQGIHAFLATFFEELLTSGTAVGEMALTGGHLTHLYNADLNDIALCRGSNPLETLVCIPNGAGYMPAPYPALILKSVRNPEPGKVYGTSILKGLPFVSDILLKIFQTVGLNWERCGNVRFAVTYKPQNDALDQAYAKERAEQIAAEWSSAMQSGSVKDFVAVGDVSIRAIGSDNQILNSEVPVRQLLEQIVAKLGIPPFLLGLSWSSTERMSYQQADLLTSEIDAYRRDLNPVIRKICETFLRLEGLPGDFSIEWESLTLQDITELSRSAYYNAQSEKIRSEIKGGTP